MRITSTQQKFLDSETAAIARAELERMVKDDTFNTYATYTAITEDDLSFVEKHMNYLSQHPKLDPYQYLANLRLMTRKKH